jgi:hypothetical protein
VCRVKEITLPGGGRPAPRHLPGGRATFPPLRACNGPRPAARQLAARPVSYGKKRRPSTGAIQLLARSKGLYKLTFEDVFPRGRRPVSQLRLSRRGESVPFFLDRFSFGPGPSLYFLRDGAGLNPNAQVMVQRVLAFEARARDLSGRPSSSPTTRMWLVPSKPTPTISPSPSSSGTRSRSSTSATSPPRAWIPAPPFAVPWTTALLSSGVLSYIGHGSIAVWASENVWNNLDVATLQPQGSAAGSAYPRLLERLLPLPALELSRRADGQGRGEARSPRRRPSRCTERLRPDRVTSPSSSASTTASATRR